MGSDVFKKLRFNDGLKSLIVNAPEFYLAMLNDCRIDTNSNMSAPASYDFIQLFAYSQRELIDLLQKNQQAGKFDCLLWACYPKGTGNIKSDLNRNTVWKIFEMFGLRPVSQIAIDDTWSALRARPADLVGK